jgi:hypothetical protein
MRLSRPTKSLLVGIALAAFVATFASCGDDDDSLRATDGSARGEGGRTDSQTGGLPIAAATAAGKPAAPATGGTTGNGGAGNADAVTSLDRKIIFNAKLELEATDVRASFNDVTRIARSAGGFVERSTLDERPGSGDRTTLHGTLSLRVPSTRYGDVVADLQSLAGVKVKKEQSSSSEVTDQYTDLTSRQRNLERSEAQYLKLYEQAKSIQEILTIQERLDSVRLQIEQIQGRLKVLDDLTQLATIDVTLTPPPAIAVKTESNPKGVKQSFVDAWDFSETLARNLASVAAALAALLVWFGLPLLLAAAGYEIWRRKGGRRTSNTPEPDGS